MKKKRQIKSIPQTLSSFVTMSDTNYQNATRSAVNFLFQFIDQSNKNSFPSLQLGYFQVKLTIQINWITTCHWTDPMTLLPMVAGETTRDRCSPLVNSCQEIDKLVSKLVCNFHASFLPVASSLTRELLPILGVKLDEHEGQVCKLDLEASQKLHRVAVEFGLWICEILTRPNSFILKRMNYFI